ncbi:MAG: hypothetical protein IPK46_09005 [Saprospiraceae bacterium]|nr:hypothetical protein [Saprospiraceae bacterium]
MKSRLKINSTSRNSDADSRQALIFGNFATNDLRLNGKTLQNMSLLMMTPRPYKASTTTTIIMALG